MDGAIELRFNELVEVDEPYEKTRVLPPNQMTRDQKRAFHERRDNARSTVIVPRAALGYSRVMASCYHEIREHHRLRHLRILGCIIDWAHASGCMPGIGPNSGVGAIGCTACATHDGYAHHWHHSHMTPEILARP